jgi:hypothetical protein
MSRRDGPSNPLATQEIKPEDRRQKGIADNDGADVSPSPSDKGIETPATEHTQPIPPPMVSPGSVESTASIETVRPTNPHGTFYL